MNSAIIKGLCDFIDASPTAFHAVDSLSAALTAVGAHRLDEGAAWKLEPGALYFLERSGSALIAFRPGLGSPAEAGFSIAAAHTDSPALKLRLERPMSCQGMERAAVELYGSPIISSWLDRPLALAGRVVFKNAEGRAESRLINSAAAVGVVPNLAIHLNRDINKGFEYNAQTQLPVLLSAELSARSGGADLNEERSSPPLSRAVKIAAHESGVEPGQILGADLFFVESQRPCLLGARGELINGYRLDDLLGCHAILDAFLDCRPARHTQIAAFLDHEEIGSRSAMGADSFFLRDLLGRVASLLGCGTQDFYRALAVSFCVSVDVAQALHPSYAEKFDDYYSPLLNKGPAVKVNASQRYATDARGEARFGAYCESAGVACQKYQSRADASPGSTVGPMIASLTGIPTVDVGAPLLSMHSIRETAGVRDHEAMIAVLGQHFAADCKDHSF